MDFEQEIRTLARRAIMEEINNLGIKALLREQIVEAGFTHEEIRNMINETIDSYCRSALGRNNISDWAKVQFEKYVNQAARQEVDKITGRLSSWRGSDEVEKGLVEAVRKETFKGYDIKVSISQKEQ